MELEERAASARKRHIPIIDERQITGFDAHLQRLGTWNTTGKSATNDGAPGIVRLQWIIPGERWCDEDGMLQFLDQRLHRQVLHWLLHSSPLTAAMRFSFQYGRSKWNEDECIAWGIDQLAIAVGQDHEVLQSILHFLTLQGYLVAQHGGRWIGGPALASVYNLGATLEWCVQAHFQRRYQAIARRCVHFKEWEALGLNDLDVLAFVDDLVFMAECKSSTDITQGQLARFVKRAQSFPADIALLLIDTESLSSVTTRANQIKTLLGAEETNYEEPVQHKGSLIVSYPRNIYIANIGESIFHTLEHLLQIWRIRKDRACNEE